MCWCLPNDIQCKSFIESHTCPAFLKQETTCHSHSGNLLNLVAVANLIRIELSVEMKYPPSILEQQARLALSDLD